VSVPSRQAAPSDPGRTEQPTPSGRLLLRMPRSLHGALTEAAERDGTSLNQFITGTLASAIGWKGESGDGGQPRRLRAPGPGGQAEASRTLVILLVANAIAVGLAALGAVGILLLAWLG
jgi:hypothetical protein